MQSVHGKEPLADEAEPIASQDNCHEDIRPIFARLLPSVSSSTIETFAENMATYHAAFRAHKESGWTKYESAPEYRDATHSLLTVQADDYWIHSPEFKQVPASAIGAQFGTAITHVSVSSPCAPWQTIAFVNEARTRWVTTIERDGERLHVSALLPFSNTDIRPSMSKRANELTDSDKVPLNVYDI